MNAFRMDRAIVPPNYVLDAANANLLRFDILRTNPDGSRSAFAVVVDLTQIVGKEASTVEAIRKAYTAILASWGWDERLR